MDTRQTAFHDEADTLATRATHLLLGLMMRGVSGLLREVRGLKARVRLWLMDLARSLPVLPARETREKRPKGNAKSRAATGYRKGSRFGLTLFVSPPKPASSEAAALGQDKKPRAKARPKSDPVATLAEIVFALHDLKRTIADPRAALDHIARRRRAKRAEADAPAAPDSAAITRPYADATGCESDVADGAIAPFDPRADSS